MSQNAYIICALRTPVMPRGGAFSRLDVHQLAAPVIKACLSKTGANPDQIDQLVLGNALSGGGNPARRCLLEAGLPLSLSGISIDTQCVSSLDAILLARDMILSGRAELVLAGGAESYSRRPVRMATDPDGGPPRPYDQPPFTPWPGRDPDMHEAAAALASRFLISRTAQENWAIESHRKARAASAALACELVDPGQLIPRADGFTRRLSQAVCAKAPVISGSVTSATAAVAADAAAFVLVASDRMARQLGSPAVTIRGGCTLGGPPEWPGLAPVAAINKSLGETSLRAADLATAEIMEAYAVQAMVNVEQAGLDPSIVNSKGGALARGHPTGASGAILAVRLYHELITSGGSGLAAIAAAGGLGSALILSAD